MNPEKFVEAEKRMQNSSEAGSFCFEHDGLIVRGIDSCDRTEMGTFHKLRYGYFVEEKKWVAPCGETPYCERDGYDAACLHLAVFQGDHPVAYLRALPWHEGLGFMLERDFRCLLSDEALAGLHKKSSLEISRLVLAPALPPAAVLPVTELLFKALYRLCRESEIEHLYAVLEPGWLRRFTRCFHLPFQAIGAAQRFPDGTRAVAAYAHLRELERSLQAVDPQKLRWYQTD